jgi:hypothetical protein
MRKRDGHQLAPGLLAAYLEGEVTPSEAAAVAQSLADSPEARGDLQDLRCLRERLSETPVDLAEVDLVNAVRAKIRRPSARRPLGIAGPWLGIALGATATCAVLFFWARPALVPRPTDQLAAKAAAGDHRPNGERWAGVKAFEEPVTPAQAPVAIDKTLHVGRGLLFSYSNLGPQPFSHLMIFTRDPTGDVRWFFPAYEDPATHPRSIAIRTREADVLLSEVVRQPFRNGPLALFALFSRQALAVEDVESWLGAKAAASPLSLPADSPAPWGDVYVQRIALMVVP